MTKLIFEKRDGYVYATYNGPSTLEIATEIFSQSIQAAKHHGVKRIMIGARLENVLSTEENYELASVFKDVGFKGFKLAWVNLIQATVDRVEFVEYVLNTKGFDVKIFYNLDKGKKWLLQ